MTSPSSLLGTDQRGSRVPSNPRGVAADPMTEFQRAIEDYKRESGRLFPTWSEVLEVARALGYMKAAGEGS